MFKRILLAVDGSDHAERAAKVAADLARRMESEMWIVVAYDPIPPFLGEPNMQEAIHARLEDAQAILKKAEAIVGEVPGGIHTEMLEGSSAEAIIEVAKTRENDLIVMGSRGRGRLAGLVLGSTSQKVVSHAPCPVLIVR